MSDIAIKFENISKQYRLGVVGTGTISHDLNRWWHLVRGKEDPYLQVGQVNDRSKKATSDYVWALKDINFEVKQGDVVGIIGKNGAGKSTLLKILSRVTSPTTGSIKAKGRIASLLEVGTGFHPELTGRENIYMNGAIMGMTKAEIARKLDEIVDFAGVEMYLDTPSKRYSSGMTVRLGFAIAAHLEPEILVVDEVLAVGDAEFQKKAIGKMQDVSKGEGRTVLFVSHNMSAVERLCQRGIILRNGGLFYDGTIEKAIEHYIDEQIDRSNTPISELDRWTDNTFRIQNLKFLNSKDEEVTAVKVGDSLKIVVEFEATEKFWAQNTSKMDISINSMKGSRVTWLSTSIFQERLQRGTNEICFVLDKVMFMEGSYNFNIYVATPLGTSDHVANVKKLDVVLGNYFNSSITLTQAQIGTVITDFKIE